tara:strand:+ start:3050 stop:3922 length:873 start_codon:yes stop_codon:yes gene_type:complete
MFVVLLLLLMSIFKLINKSRVRDGFINQTEEYSFLENVDVFDDFYAKLYDYLVFNDVKNDYEVGEILKLYSQGTDKIVLLDVGSGTGHHVNKLSNNRRVSEAVGIDISPAMISESKEKYPSKTWVLGNVLSPNVFDSERFTHITSLYFTIYYLKDKMQFFKNCMKWLKPGGYLIIHLVDKDKFDPILPPGNPLYIVSPQKYAKERITKTKITFSDFVYNSNFNLDGNVATFDEKFKFNDGKIRHQQQTLYMEDTDDIIAMAQQCGFTIHSIADMIKCAYENQYLYILTKP